MTKPTECCFDSPVTRYVALLVPRGAFCLARFLSLNRLSYIKRLDMGAELMTLRDRNVVVTGGSRGLGLGLVEALVARGARVTVVARDANALEAARNRLGVDTISADVTDEAGAQHVLAKVAPDILVLNAGATPRMGRLDQLSWAEFTGPWETDVKAGLYWLKAALNLPLRPGSRVLVGSSGAAQEGSPLSGGYAGAKRMLWMMAKYANGVSKQKNLEIRFQAIVPLQIVGDTGVGDEASSAYAHHMGIKREEFLARFGAPMPPREFGEKVLSCSTIRNSPTVLPSGSRATRA
jgi:NAD(P)-dependent dehydrogenase (short-subunit alcohol dehydrogenase family)